MVGPLRHLEGVCGRVEEGGCLGCVFKKGGALLSTPHITSVFHLFWANHATSVCLSNLPEMERGTREREEKERGKESARARSLLIREKDELTIFCGSW